MIIPRIGDVWEYKLPNKRKKIKTIHRVSWIWCERKNGSLVRKPFVEWKRLPKGRYTSLRVKSLLKYGKLIERV